MKLLYKYVASHNNEGEEAEHPNKFVVGRTLPTNLTLSYMSVNLPIFMIHGNHDDPSGFENISNVDILAATKLV